MVHFIGEGIAPGTGSEGGLGIWLDFVRFALLYMHQIGTTTTTVMATTSADNFTLFMPCQLTRPPLNAQRRSIRCCLFLYCLHQLEGFAYAILIAFQ